MTVARTKLARLLVVALTIAAAAAGLARADLADGAPELQFLGQHIVPTGTQFEGTEFGGLSGLAFDARRQVFYALSDDPSQIDPARFYTLRIGVTGGCAHGADPRRDDAHGCRRAAVPGAEPRPGRDSR